MGCVGGYQGQAHTYPVGLAKEGLSFSFLDSRRPCSLVLKAAGDGPSCNVTSWGRFRKRKIKHAKPNVRRY